MPQVTWETIIGALALVAIVAGAQYVRTSGNTKLPSSSSLVEETKGSVGGKASSGKKKQKKKPATTTTGSSSDVSYAEVAEAKVEQVKRDLVEPVQSAVKKTTKKKKSKAAKPVESDRSVIHHTHTIPRLPFPS